MSQRLWEHPDYEDQVVPKLLAKLGKCLRHGRYTEAKQVSTELHGEIMALETAERVAREMGKGS